MSLALDHVLIAHDDLEAGIGAVRRLGFRPTPLGHHGQGLGTANATVMMPDRKTYFEVLGVTEPTERNLDKRHALSCRGAHLYGIAFKGDAHAAAAGFAEAGLEGGPAFDFMRAVDLPDGARDARFTIAPMRTGALPGLYTFVCQHHTVDVVWRPDYLDHPNGALSVTGLWGVTDDPAPLARAWRAVLGDGVHETEAGVEARIGDAVLRYLTPARWQDRFGERLSATTAHLRVLEVATGPETALRGALGAGNVPYTTAEDGILVPDSLGLGARVLFRPG